MYYHRIPAVMFVATLFIIHSYAQGSVTLLASEPILYRRGDVPSKPQKPRPRKEPDPATHGTGIAGDSGTADTIRIMGPIGRAARSSPPRKKSPEEKAGISSSRPSTPRRQSLADAERAASQARVNYKNLRKEYESKDAAHFQKFDTKLMKNSDQAHQGYADLIRHQDRVISAKITHTDALNNAKKAAMAAQNTNRAARNHIKAKTAQKTADQLVADRKFDEASLEWRKAHVAAEHNKMWKGPDHPDTKATDGRQRDTFLHRYDAQENQKQKGRVRYEARRQQGKDSDSSGDETIFSGLDY